VNTGMTVYVPKLVETGEGKVTTLMAPTVQTDRTIPNDKQDIIIRGNEKEHACR